MTFIKFSEKERNMKGGGLFREKRKRKEEYP